MTEFVHKPYDKIYVRDMIKLSLDDLIGMMSSLDFHDRICSQTL